MCSPDNENYEASNIADLRKQVEEIKTSLEEANRNLQTLLARIPNLSTNWPTKMIKFKRKQWGTNGHLTDHLTNDPKTYDMIYTNQIFLSYAT